MAEIINHRHLILTKIRRSLGESSPTSEILAEYDSIPRTYITAGTLDSKQRKSLFISRLEEYDAGVYLTTEDSIAGKVQNILGSRSKNGLAVPAGIPQAWLPTGLHFRDASSYDAYELDVTQGILTACTVAIAETGTIVLQNALDQGSRMLSLVPDYHLCVVFASQIVATVPEAFIRLGRTSTLPTTFISGPSATADIEMTRIKGVHGPRFLDILIVE